MVELLLGKLVRLGWRAAGVAEISIRPRGA